MNSLNILISKFSDFILHIKEISPFQDNDLVNSNLDISDDDKIKNVKKLNDLLLLDVTNFNYFLKKKLKLFSHKNSDTTKISESLLGPKYPLKKIFNNQDDTIKLVLWSDLHNLILLYNKYLIDNNLDEKNIAEGIINKINLVITESQPNTAEIKENLNKILNTDNLNDTTNNMINDIFTSFQNSKNLNPENPFGSIFELSKTISEKYQDKIENGDINLDDLLKNMTKLPGMENIAGIVDKLSSTVSNQQEKEKVIIDENYSTANIDVGAIPDENNLLSSLNVGTLLKGMESFGINPLSNSATNSDNSDINNMMNMMTDEEGIKNMINSNEFKEMLSGDGIKNMLNLLNKN